MRLGNLSLGTQRVTPAAWLAIAAALGLSACDKINSMFNPAPNLKFGAYSEGYQTKADFAQIESDFPLTPADLNKLTPENLKNYDQEQMDQIYARLSAGPIPDGPYDGGLFFPKGQSGERRVSEIIGGLPGLAAELKTVKIEMLGAALWKGKVFYRNERLLRNRIEDTTLLKPLIDGDLSTIPKITVHGRDQWLMFPARLYCGQSLLDSRRESVIIDYFFTDELPGFASGRITSPAATAYRCAMRSAWFAPVSIWDARTPAKCSCSTSRSTTPKWRSATIPRSPRPATSKRTAGRERRAAGCRPPPTDARRRPSTPPASAHEATARIARVGRRSRSRGRMGFDRARSTSAPFAA
jgi:hypothetical protein